MAPRPLLSSFFQVKKRLWGSSSYFEVCIPVKQVETTWVTQSSSISSTSYCSQLTPVSLQVSSHTDLLDPDHPCDPFPLVPHPVLEGTSRFSDVPSSALRVDRMCDDSSDLRSFRSPVLPTPHSYHLPSPYLPSPDTPVDSVRHERFSQYSDTTRPRLIHVPPPLTRGRR